jgi:hypothetical protein
LSIFWKYKNLKQFSKLQVHGMTQFAPHNPFWTSSCMLAYS